MTAVADGITEDTGALCRIYTFSRLDTAALAMSTLAALILTRRIVGYSSSLS